MRQNLFTEPVSALLRPKKQKKYCSIYLLISHDLYTGAFSSMVEHWLSDTTARVQIPLQATVFFCFFCVKNYMKSKHFVFTK